MSKSMSAFASLALANLGAMVSMQASDSSYVVDGLDAKMGTMKNGDKERYVVLRNPADTEDTISLHPEKAKELFNKGEQGSLRILKDIASADPVAVTEVKAEVPAEAAESTEAAVKTEEKVKEPSKKEKAAAIFKEVYATAEGKRKDVIARFKSELGMSDAGASTYHQNFKSGNWAV